MTELSVAITSTYPASAAQQRLWFLDRMQPGNPSYNMSQVFRLRGDLDVAALQEAIREVVRRHDSLRTIFQNENHTPVQVVAETVNTETPIVDLTAKRWVDSPGEIQSLIDSEVRQSFDLETGPLFRSKLIRLAANDHLLLLVEHHIVFDRTSEGLLLAELSSLYGNAEVVALSKQYSDYSTWRDETSLSESGQRSLQYWIDKLSGIESMDLPADKRRSSAQSADGARLYMPLRQESIDALTDIAAKNGSTLFMGLATVFKTFLHLWTGSEDVAFGTPFADRRLRGTEHLLGFFVNNLVLRTDASGDPSFTELLAQVRKNCFNAYRHGSVSFERVVTQLRPSRELNRNPVYDIEFAFQKGHKQQLALDGIDIEGLTASKGTSQYDMTMTVRETRGGFDARIEYRTDLFESDTIQRLLTRFGKLLDEVCKDPSLKLSEYSLITGDEFQQSVVDWNRTEFDYPRDACLHELFSKQAAATPNNVAVRYQQQSITYSELEQRANQLAHHLIGLGVKPESYVAICVDRSIEMIVGLLAILKAGGAYLPLDRSYPNDRLSHMIEDSGVKVLLTLATLTAELPDYDATEVLLDSDHDAIKQCSTAAPQCSTDPANIAYVIYTSGSTGKPKGVQIEHRNVTNFLCSMRETPGLTRDDILLAVTTLSFDIAVLEIYLPLLIGAQTVIASHDDVIDGERLNKLLLDNHVTIMQATPVTWRLLLSSGWKGSDSFRILCGGEAMPRDLAKQLLQRCGELWNMYGPTETTVWSTCFRVDDADAPILIGKPIGNTSIYILDQYLRPVPIGMVGELYIGGDGVARGYLNRPELTDERFIDNPVETKSNSKIYRTGDGARYRSDGNIEYQNRLDNQVKVRGNRIELGEIEAAIATDNAIKQAVVIVREDVAGDPRITAYFEQHSGHETDGGRLRENLRGVLPNYMMPQYFIHLDSLPVTPNGKIDRKALPAPHIDTDENAESYVAPRTAAEQLVAKIWSSVLKIEKIGKHDNFVELGGHSLLALQVISQLKQETGESVSPVSMIMGSLEQIAIEIGGDEDAADVAPDSVSSGPPVQPFYFGPTDEQLFGLYHPSATASSRRHAVVLCPPIFLEGIKAHWALKRLADQLSALGFDVLRFDYQGTGDSGGDGQFATIDEWIGNIQSAATEILRRADADSLSIVGLRFGATLAALCPGLQSEHLVLWDPVVTGDTYLAELDENHQQLLALCNAGRKHAVVEQHNELLGYECSPEFRRSISKVQLFADVQNRAKNTHVVISSQYCSATAFENGLANGGQSVSAQLVEDATCTSDGRAGLSAFLPGPILGAVRDCLTGKNQ